MDLTLLYIFLTCVCKATGIFLILLLFARLFFLLFGLRFLRLLRLVIYSCGSRQGSDTSSSRKGTWCPRSASTDRPSTSHETQLWQRHRSVQVDRKPTAAAAARSRSAVRWAEHFVQRTQHFLVCICQNTVPLPSNLNGRVAQKLRMVRIAFAFRVSRSGQYMSVFLTRV